MPKLLQTEIMDGPGSRVAMRSTIDIEAGNQLCKKALIVTSTVWNERPQTLIKWTSSFDPALPTLTFL